MTELITTINSLLQLGFPGIVLIGYWLERRERQAVQAKLNTVYEEIAGIKIDQQRVGLIAETTQANYERWKGTVAEHPVGTD
jgi:hypothetical protein